MAQPEPWKIYHLRKPMKLSLILALLKKRCPMQLLLPMPPERIFIDCSAHHIDPFLQNLSNSVPCLQVFAARYREGQISPSGQPIWAKIIFDALLSVP